MTWYYDADDDGYGIFNKIKISQTKPNGKWVAVSGDCKPTDPTVHPNAPEVPDGKDNDCDGLLDEESTCPTWYYDADEDGYGIHNKTVVNSCGKPNGKWVLLVGDCKPTDPSVYPNAIEICDGKDNDCDGAIDEDCVLITSTKSKKPSAKVDVNTEILEASIWPNPTRTELMVTLNAFVPNEKLSITMMQADGKVQQSQNLIPAVKGQQVRLDVSSAAGGYYILLIKQQGQVISKKALIVR
jgi:hypothetical protein